MIISLADLKLHPHTSRELLLSREYSDEILAGVGGSFREPVQVRIMVENNGRALAGKGTVYTTVDLVCSRCLMPVNYPVNVSLNVKFVEKPEEHSQETEEHLLNLPESGDVDLSPAVEEAILFGLPLIPLCRDNCLGLCPGCGADLNTQKCCCQEQDIDPRWQKLKELK